MNWVNKQNKRQIKVERLSGVRHDGRSFQWTSLKSGLQICHFRFHYGRSIRSPSICNSESRNRCTKSVDAFGAVSPGYFCCAFSQGNEIYSEAKFSDGQSLLLENIIRLHCAQLTSILKLMPDAFKTSSDEGPCCYLMTKKISLKPLIFKQ
ncbi:hypothetical protein TNCV_557451 [Trichonephila clavipes]|nr:hypothetical protein TNCV_557451 [Trichonephila clavipes]